MHRDSIKFPDSLTFKTLRLKREVYGGGGIMPDYFVPLDTSEITPLYKNLSRKGIFNTFTFNYVDKHRAELKEKYPTFEKYRDEFDTEKEVMNDFWQYAMEQDSIEINTEEYAISKQLITTLIKARMASDLWDNFKFYPIYNSKENEIFIRGLELIEGNTIKKLGLDY
jgi:carboxyl-terminal processing protease